MTTPPPVRELSRRRLLIAAGLVGGGALVAGCGLGADAPEPPDPLLVLAARARDDAALAEATGVVHPELAPAMAPVAADRRTHADALTAEINRVRPPRSSTAPPPDAPSGSVGAPPGSPGSPPGSPPGLPQGPPVVPEPDAALQAVRDALAAAQAQAAVAVPGLPRFRAGLIGSVAACCAAHQAVLG